MKTRLIPADAPGAVEEAATALANGELVAFPTDTVYGLAAGHDHLRKLYIAKDRSKDKRIPILLSDASNLEASAMVTPAARALAARFWPGPLSIILDRGPTPVGEPSTVVDCSTEPITVLREGAISKAELEEALIGVESLS